MGFGSGKVNAEAGDNEEQEDANIAKPNHRQDWHDKPIKNARPKPVVGTDSVIEHDTQSRRAAQGIDTAEATESRSASRFCLS